MDALTCQYVRQTHARRRHSHPHFTSFRLGAFLLNNLQCVRSAVVGDEDSRVSHEGPQMAPALWARHVTMSVITLTTSQPAARHSGRRPLLLIIFNACRVKLVQLSDACAIAHQGRYH